jgi:hypothetical protein
MSDPKILLLDVETSGMTSYHWGRWQQNINQKQVIHESILLCYAAKWLGSRDMYSEGLCDFEGAMDERNDLPLIESLWTLLDEADIVIGHYVKRFDIPEINRRFAVHGLPPPSPYKMICTKEAAKRYFRFSSNRLGDLGEALGVGSKLSHEGFEMWRKCFENDERAWKKMMRYNIQDVKLLEKVYLRLRPYMSNHPNLGLYIERDVCPNCGGKHVQSRGTSVTRGATYQRYHCQNKVCGTWFRGSKRISAATSYRNITA